MRGNLGQPDRCLDRFDLWDKESGQVIRPDWTVPCEFDTSGPSIPFEIDSSDLEWNAPTLVGGSYVHVFPNKGIPIMDANNGGSGVEYLPKAWKESVG